MATTPDDMFELKSAMDLLRASLFDMTDGTRRHTEEIERQIAAQKEEREQAAASAEADKKLKKATADLTAAKNNAKSKTIGLANQFQNLIDAGIKFGASIGVTATKGVELDIKNRINSAATLFTWNANLMASADQIKAAQSGFAQAFIGAREGMQISSDGATQFVRDLKQGFGSEFEPTAETFRMLTQMGMSTTKEFEAFRKATGRASLSNNQLSTLYNKNQLSFLLYGNSFAKAATQAEKLGINLASIQAAQEGLVTNLDGTIDTVAQINQLGGQIDFGNLVRIAEQDGPDALMAYVRATVPSNLMQSASTRALFRQLGISVEDYLKSGNKQVSAADDMEAKMTEAAKETGAFTKGLSTASVYLSKAIGILNSPLVTLAISAANAASSLMALSVASKAKAAAEVGLSSAGGTLPAGRSAIGMGAGAMKGLKFGAGIGVATGLMSGIGEYQQSGNAAKAFGRGIANMAGTMIGASLGGAIGGLFSFGLAAPLGIAIGSSIGSMASNWIFDKFFNANDMVSPGYGNRMLVTPKATFALNNADDIIAGTKLFPKDSLSMGGGNNAQLAAKVDKLIDALANATTVININGTNERVPRMQLVGVYSRNEMR